MGRGDKRTKQGKIFKGSFGNVRPKKKKTTAASTTASK
jgi:30S ribosomal protein S31